MTETPTQVLDVLRDAQARADAAEVDKLVAGVAWAAMHSADSVVEDWCTSLLPLGGVGAPEAAESCVAEYAAVLGVSTDSGQRQLAAAVELRYRLPQTYAAVLAGACRVWKAKVVTDHTMSLSREAAAFVDSHLASVVGRIGFAAIERLVEEARVRFDPEAAEAKCLAAAKARRFDVHTRQVGFDGTVDVSGTLDLADALDLDEAVTRGAAHLAALGNAEPLDVRRSMALGEMARRDATLDLDTGSNSSGGGMTLYVHLADPDVARCENTRTPVSVEQVREWCTRAGTTVTIRPVLDLGAQAHTTSYEVPDRMRAQVTLRDPHCVFPHCTRPSRRVDLDHIQPWDDGGRTTPDNLAPLCRRHHRTKTHHRWRYHRTDVGSYEWTSPHGHRFVVTRGLTRLATESSTE